MTLVKHLGAFVSCMKAQAAVSAYLDLPYIGARQSDGEVQPDCPYDLTVRAGLVHLL